MSEFEGKVAVVTGAASGIGLGVTERFLGDACPPLVLGKSRLLLTNCGGFDPATETPDVAILVFGALAERAADAADRLAPQARVALRDQRIASGGQKRWLKA